MDIPEMRRYVQHEIHKQGSASAKVLAPLFTAIIDKLSSADSPTGSSVLEKYNSSADWTEVRSAVEANRKIVIA